MDPLGIVIDVFSSVSASVFSDKQCHGSKVLLFFSLLGEVFSYKNYRVFCLESLSHQWNCLACCDVAIGECLFGTYISIHVFKSNQMGTTHP